MFFFSIAASTAYLLAYVTVPSLEYDPKDQKDWLLTIARKMHPLVPRLMMFVRQLFSLSIGSRNGRIAKVYIEAIFGTVREPSFVDQRMSRP